jgi:tetratricopeptide (TPR) repeat protein
MSARARVVATCGALLALGAPLHAQEGVAQPANGVARAKACFERGQSAYAANKLNDAEAGFTCAFALAPSPELAWNLGRVYERLGDSTRGIRFYRLYLESSAVPAAERADTERRIAELEAARDKKRAQLKTDFGEQKLPEAARAELERGLKLYRAGQYAEALTALSAALRGNDAVPELHFDVAVASERMRKLREAIAHFRAYLAARPTAEDRADVEARIATLRRRAP